MRALARALVVGASFIVLGACALTKQAEEANRSGFLGDYSEFRAGVGDEALLVYRRPGADFTRYRALMISSVTIWRSTGTADVSSVELDRLGKLLQAKLRARLSRQFRIAPGVGEGTLRIRAALTEAHGANVAKTAVAKVHPGDDAPGAAARAFVGGAGAEIEVVDSVSGERLFAAVDRRVGTATVRNAFSEWSDVEDAFDVWAEKVAQRLVTEGVRTK